MGTCLVRYCRESPSGAQYKRTETKSKRNLAKYLRLAAFVTRATCVISGRTVEMDNNSLGYCLFPPLAEQAKSYQTSLCLGRLTT